MNKQKENKKAEKEERKKQKKNEREKPKKHLFGKFRHSKQETNNNNNNNEQRAKVVSLSISSSQNYSKHHQIMEGIKKAWNRKRDIISTQLGKDFPRFANKIIFGPPLPTSSIYKLMENDPPLSHVLADGLLPSGFIVPSLSDFRLLSNIDKQKYHMKLVLLIITKLFEGEESKQYKYIQSNFDKEFEKAGDMGLTCSSFLDRSFIYSINEEKKDQKAEEGRDQMGGEDDQNFGERTKGMNLLRSCTQGHFASAVTAFQGELGLPFITSNIRHFIYIQLPPSLIPSDNIININDINNISENDSSIKNDSVNSNDNTTSSISNSIDNSSNESTFINWQENYCYNSADSFSDFTQNSENNNNINNDNNIVYRNDDTDLDLDVTSDYDNDNIGHNDNRDNGDEQEINNEKWENEGEGSFGLAPLCLQLSLLNPLTSSLQQNIDDNNDDNIDNNKDNDKGNQNNNNNNNTNEEEIGIKITHVKGEGAGWGALFWHLTCQTDLSSLSLLNVEFFIDNLLFTNKPIEEEIKEKLKEFLSLEMTIKLGLELNFFEQQIKDDLLPLLLLKIFSLSKEFQSEITKMNFNHNLISIIPADISCFSELTHLSLIKNNFSLFPTAISSLSSLRVLSIGMNQIKEIPEEIGKLKALEELRCSNNQIQKIHANIGELSNLRVLTLSTNSICTLPLKSLLSLTQLHSLTLFNNPIADQVPDQFSSNESISQFCQSLLNTKYNDQFLFPSPPVFL